MASEDIKIVRNILIGFLVLFSFIFAISISTNSQTELFNLIKAMGFFVIASIISFLIYSSKDYQSSLIGINKKNILMSLLVGAFVGLVFYFGTKLIPGLSIGVPLVPGSIGTELRFFIVVLIAPIVEEIFFRGALLGYIKNFKPTKKNIVLAIIIQAILFAIFHLGAYVSGIYDLPSFSAGFLGFTANISVFISAFLFGLIAGFLVYNGKIKNLISSMTLHFIVNLIIYTSFAITFA